MMTAIRQILHRKHELVDHWSVRSFCKNGKIGLVDAIQPITYYFSNGEVWKQFRGNKKKYPLLDNYRDFEYYKALVDISNIKFS